MKFSPVAIEEKPETNTPITASTTWLWVNAEESGG